MDVNLSNSSKFNPSSYRANSTGNSLNNASPKSGKPVENQSSAKDPAATVELNTSVPANKTGVYSPTSIGATKSSQASAAFEFTYSESTSTTIETTISRSVDKDSSEKLTASKLSQKDSITIKQLQEEADRRTEQLRKLVEALLSKQGTKLTGFNPKEKSSLTDEELIAALKSGKLEVDEETAKKAAEDISEDGYWGVKQTSERLVSFAMSLSGNDSKYADSMINAIKKGYQDAESKWGGELPEICKKTLEAAIKKMEEWRDNAAVAEKNGTAATTDNTVEIKVSYAESKSFAYSSTMKTEA